jgi:N-acetylglucosamine kinase-like BadF-type ATPase
MIVLGIDQGSTHTRALLVDDSGRMPGLGLAEGACHAYVGMDKAMQAIQKAARLALQQAQLEDKQIHLLYTGMTGADWADEYTLLHDNICQLGLCNNVIVANDAIIALRGGSDASYGAILIQGSGGNCAVRAPDRREFIYGYFLESPIQGGSGLGHTVLMAIYRAHTGREVQTRLTAAALHHFGLNTVDELLRANVEDRLDGASIRHLAPLLFRAGAEGDELANQIITRFANGCAEAVCAGLRRLEMTHLPLQVVLSGSIFKAEGTLLIDTIRAGILPVAPGATLVNARYEPVVGAALLGLEAAGVHLTPAVLAEIESSARRLNLVRV